MSSLTIQQIKRSAWARRFKAECPEQYDEALYIAQNVGTVTLDLRDDHSAKGDYVWAIIPETNMEFWLDGLPTKAEAVKLCTRMGWPIKSIWPDLS